MRRPPPYSRRERGTLPAGQVVMTLCFSAFLFGTATHTEQPFFYPEGNPTSLARESRTNGDKHLAELAEETDPKKTGRGAFLVKAEGKPIAMATLVDPRGFFLTKSSELPPEALIEIEHEGELRKATVLDTFSDHDLTLLFASGHPNLPKLWPHQAIAPPKTTKLDPIGRGHWLISPHPDGKTSLGAVGSPSRAIKSAGPALGIVLADPPNGQGVFVQSVFENSAASAAGFKRADVVVTFEGNKIPDRRSLIAEIKKCDPGQSVSVGLVRDGEENEILLVLGDRSVFEDEFDRINVVSGRLSRRKTGFPAVIQHDTPLQWKDMGGPVYDLEGRWIGINIARVNRLATYLIPLEAFREEVEKAISDHRPEKSKE